MVGCGVAACQCAMLSQGRRGDRRLPSGKSLKSLTSLLKSLTAIGKRTTTSGFFVPWSVGGSVGGCWLVCWWAWQDCGLVVCEYSSGALLLAKPPLSS